MSLSEALVEAYANAPADEIVIETLEIDHPTFDAPIRIATGIEEDIDLPLAENGQEVTHKALQVIVIPPGVTEDGPTPMRVRIDNISLFLLPHLRDALQGTAPLSVVYRAYTTSDLSKPGEVIGGLQLRSVTMTAAWVEGTVGFREIERQAFPLRTYDEEFYPTLQQI